MYAIDARMQLSVRPRSGVWRRTPGTSAAAASHDRRFISSTRDAHPMPPRPRAPLHLLGKRWTNVGPALGRLRVVLRRMRTWESTRGHHTDARGYGIL